MKKGFTLVELLAVIVILSIILVIAVPKVKDYIISSKERSFMDSAKSILRQLEYINLESDTFNEKSLSEFDIDISNIDYDINNSVVYFKDDKLTINLVGNGHYSGMYACEVTSSSSKDVSYTPCEILEHN